MLETAVALVFAHVAADFLLQTDAMVRAKRRPHILALHGAIVATAAWAALGFAPAAGALLLVTLGHVAIDAIKAHASTPGIRSFLLDQAAHLLTIALATAIFPAAYGGGLWADPPAALGTLRPVLDRLPEAMTLAAGLVAATVAGGHAVRLLMASLAVPEQLPGLPKGGQTIGVLERLMILILVLLGEPTAIGFLIAAKSVLRFSEIRGDELASEYVIIGTLASFAWALGIAWATDVVLAALAST